MVVGARRSLLFSPGANARAMEKAKSLPADGLIFDLEDSVSPEEKPAARERVSAVLAEPGYQGRERLVRVNALDTEWAEDDIRAAAQAGADGVLVPKIYSSGDVGALSRLLADCGGQTRLWVMIETARALLDIADIAKTGSSPETPLAGIILGTNDIARETHVPMVPGRGPMLSWLSQCVLAARAYNLTVIDSVFNDFRNPEGLREECLQGRDLGFDGKTVIHPAQIDTVNQVYSPSDEVVARAQAIIDAFDQPENRDKAVISLDGEMVERLHLEMAKRTLTLRVPSV